MAGGFFQAIVFDCVVENRRELVVDALEIGLGVRLAIFIPIAGQGVLPLAHMSGLDLVQRDFLEEGRYLQVDQPFLAGNGGGLEAVLHILDIQGDEVTEGHAEAARGLADKVPFPLKGFLLGGKATLLLVDGLARPVRHADLGHPATGVAVFLLLTFLPPSLKNQALMGLFTHYSRFTVFFSKSSVRLAISSSRSSSSGSVHLTAFAA